MLAIGFLFGIYFAVKRIAINPFVVDGIAKNLPDSADITYCTVVAALFYGAQPQLEIVNQRECHITQGNIFDFLVRFEVFFEINHTTLPAEYGALSDIAKFQTLGHKPKSRCM